MMHRSSAVLPAALPAPSLLLGLMLSLIVGCCNTPHGLAPSHEAVVFPYQWQGEIDRGEFNEPSGAVFHPQRRTLFVVGDEGDIAELKADGQVVKTTTVRRGADFEGVTCDPATGLLYVAVEGDEMILEVDPETFELRRSFTVDRHFQGRLRLKPTGDGLEGITFIPDAEHPEGGRFIVANQAFTLDDPEDPSALMVVEAPLRTGQGTELTARIEAMRLMPVIDLSGLHHNAERQRLYALSDSDNTILTLDRQLRILETRAFPGNDQEGLAVDAADQIYVAQDSGGIIKLQWLGRE